MNWNRETRVCIVGTSRITWRTEADAAPEPLDMWETAARRAIDDAAIRANVTDELDHLAVVHTQSWDYDHPVARLGERLGRSDIDGTYSLIAGTSPQRLVDQAAGAMMRGEMSVALVVGAEAQATLRRLAAAGESPRWSFPETNAVGIESMLSEWYLPTEIRHGILPAWLTFALLAQARWAARGGTADDRRSMFDQLSNLSVIASSNPYAWLPIAHSSERLAKADVSNRPIATPFTKLTTAFPFVDMAAANLLVTDEVADRWGVPDDRRIYLQGWGFARDASHVAARESLSSSPAMCTATSDALAMAGLESDQIDVFDLYSCFGSAIQFARDALGLRDDDPRPISLTGGLPYHGGPGSNYMNHSISTLVGHLRSSNDTTGMVTGIGMHMTKHVAGIWSSERPKHPLPPIDQPQQAVLEDAENARPVVESMDGQVTIAAASVIHGPDGAPQGVIAIGESTDGSRCYARSIDTDLIELVLADQWVGVDGTVTPMPDGTNRLGL